MLPPARQTSAMLAGAVGSQTETPTLSSASFGSETPAATRNTSTSGCAENRARHAGRHQHMLDFFRNLIDRSPTDLSHTFGHAVHAVDVGFAEQSAVRVDGQRAVNRHAAALHERR